MPTLRGANILAAASRALEWLDTDRHDYDYNAG